MEEVLENQDIKARVSDYGLIPKYIPFGLFRTSIQSAELPPTSQLILLDAGNGQSLAYGPTESKPSTSRWRSVTTHLALLILPAWEGHLGRRMVLLVIDW